MLFTEQSKKKERTRYRVSKSEKFLRDNNIAFFTVNSGLKASVVATSEVFKEQEEEKRRKYQQRVLDVEMGSFTPLVFGTNGGMGNECQRFLKHLADKIAQKDTEPYHVVITWLRTQISFELLRSVHACVRGSRTPFRSKIEQSLDCKINVASADI